MLNDVTNHVLITCIVIIVYCQHELYPVYDDIQVPLDTYCELLIGTGMKNQVLCQKTNIA